MRLGLDGAATPIGVMTHDWLLVRVLVMYVHVRDASGKKLGCGRFLVIKSGIGFLKTLQLSEPWSDSDVLTCVSRDRVWV